MVEHVLSGQRIGADRAFHRRVRGRHLRDAGGYGLVVVVHILIEDKITLSRRGELPGNFRQSAGEQPEGSSRGGVLKPK